MYLQSSLRPDPFISGFKIADYAMTPRVTRSRCDNLVGDGVPCELLPYTKNNPVCNRCSVRLGGKCNHTEQDRQEIIEMIKAGVNFDAVNQSHELERAKPKPICSVDGCYSEAAVKGMCRTHYMRQHKYGKTDPSRIKCSSRQEAFNVRYSVEADTGCWVWIGWLTHHCPRFTWGGRNTNARQYAIEMVGRKYIPFHEVKFRCGNPLCVNPDHIYQ